MQSGTSLVCRIACCILSKDSHAGRTVSCMKDCLLYIKLGFSCSKDCLLHVGLPVVY